jgi:hypothetical protein
VTRVVVGVAVALLVAVTAELFLRGHGVRIGATETVTITFDKICFNPAPVHAFGELWEGEHVSPKRTGSFTGQVRRRSKDSALFTGEGVSVELERQPGGFSNLRCSIE